MVESALGRNFRPSMIPNGATFSCSNCHNRASGGGPRTPFGNDVAAIVQGPGGVPFWSRTLAEKDSDGDGFTNGEELGDPDGDGVPIAGATVTNPGDPNSKPANQAPEVEIFRPVTGASFHETQTIQIEVTASDADGTVTRVELLAGNETVATDSETPFHFDLSLETLGAGNHTLRARAFDDADQSTLSAAVQITVLAVDAVSLAQPVLEGETVTINWEGGLGPFIVRHAPDPGASEWSSLPATADRRAVLTLDGASRFFRVSDTARHDGIPLSITLSGAAERPDPVETDASGTGTMELRGNRLTFEIQYTGLSGAATAAHIHGPANASESADVLVGIGGFAVGGLQTEGEIAGALDLTPEQAALVLNGMTYVNIHTQQHPSGEIRGQIEPQ